MAVWGPGNVGAPAIRSIVAHPQLELAGVIVHSESKQGVDAGDLAGTPATGVLTTRDAEAVLAGAPDALVYAVNQDFRPEQSRAEMLGALSRGITVVTAGFYPLLHPPTASGEVREAFAAACARGRCSFLSSGIDPGYAMDLLPVVLSGLCQEIREIRIVENFNYATYDVPPAVRAIIGFGSPIDATPPMILPGIPTSVWGGALHGLAAALDLEIESIREVVEKHPLERRVEYAGQQLEAGTLGAFRFEVQALVRGRPALIVEHITRVADDTAPQWPRARDQGFHQVRLKGRPDVVLTLESEDGGDHVAGGNATAAGRIVGAIPWLCAEPRGLVSGSDLPLIAGRGLFRFD